MSSPAREKLGAALRGVLVFGAFAPFVPSFSEGVSGLAAVGGALDAWFAFQCHRDEARSFVASAVCARCLGIYAGLALGALVLRPVLRPGRHVLWLALAAAALLLDVLSEALGWRPPSAALRFATGFALAYPAGVSMIRALRGPSRNQATAP